jgi:hypothetical protein
MREYVLGFSEDMDDAKLNFPSQPPIRGTKSSPEHNPILPMFVLIK